MRRPMRPRIVPGMTIFEKGGPVGNPIAYVQHGMSNNDDGHFGSLVNSTTSAFYQVRNSSKSGMKSLKPMPSRAV